MDHAAVTSERASAGGPVPIAGRFVPLGQVRRAPWGHVYRAADEVTNRVVRLTVVAPDVALSHDEGQAVVDEARAAAGLDHGGAVAVRGAGRCGPGFVWAEDLVGGPVLDEVLALEGPQPPARVRAIARDLIDALDAAHRQGLVHGGVSPAEVHLPAGPDGSARLGGFGLAAALVRTGEPHLLDRRYLAPEQLDGGDPDPAADWWTLGAVLFEALSGRPWSAAGGVDPSSTDHPGERDRALVAGIAGLLHVDPDRRPATAVEVRERLGLVAGLVAGPASVPAPSAARPRGDRRVVAALGACGLVALVGLALLGVGRSGLLDPKPRAAVAMPAVVGAPQVAAERQLEDAGLDVRVEVQESTTVDRGAVITQQPAAGTSARAGDLVTVVVSTGAGAVVIPDVLGLPIADAVRALEGRGLVARVEPRVTGSAPPGTVVGQAGNGGDRAERGGEVRVTVAQAT